MSRAAFNGASALCRRYAENLCELPNGKEVALECAAMLEYAAKLAPTLDESRASYCQDLVRLFFPEPIGSDVEQYRK